MVSKHVIVALDCARIMVSKHVIVADEFNDLVTSLSVAGLFGV
jgi:hypothetical protein